MTVIEALTEPLKKAACQPGNDDVAVAACVQRMMSRLKSAGFLGSPLQWFL